MDDLIGDFLADTRDSFEQLSPDLALWIANPSDRTALDAVFRFTHTVGGNSSFIGFDRFRRLCGAVEETLSAIRDGRTVADAKLVADVVAVIRRIGEISQAISNGVGLSADDEPLLIANLGHGSSSSPIASVSVAPQHVRMVRMPVERLDHLVGCVEAVAASHRQLLSMITAENASKFAEPIARLTSDIDAMTVALNTTRLQRIDRVFAGLDRVVEQTGRMLNKQISLHVTGGDILVDRDIVDGLRAPVLHIIRNALDHGIENTERRISAGKDIQGKINVSIISIDQFLQIEIEDDGAGLAAEELAKSAERAGIFLTCAFDQLSSDQIAALICTPGITTIDAPSLLSGRGVGLDAVRESILGLGGTFSVINTPGQGFLIALNIPLGLKRRAAERAA